MKYYDNVFEGYLDSEKKFYDYGTSNISGSDVFDTTTTGVSFYNQFLNSSDIEYLRDKRNLVGKIVYMSPNEYYEECGKHGWDHYISPSKLKSQRAADKDVIDHLKQVLQVYKKRFPLPFINYAENGQEGLHRMYVVGELFGWDSPKHPVLCVRWADEARAKREADRRKKEEITSTLRYAVKDALHYSYENFQDFEYQLQYELDNKFQYMDGISTPVEFHLNIENSVVTVSVQEFTYEFDYDDIRFEEEIDIDDIDIELDDYDLDMDADEFLNKYLK